MFTLSPTPSTLTQAASCRSAGASGHPSQRALKALTGLLCTGLLCTGFLCAALLIAPSAAGSPTTRLERPSPTLTTQGPSGAPLAGADLSPSLLQNDDGTAEGVFGFTGPGTRQFLFFNRFESPGPFVLERIEVLFPTGTEIEPGDAVQLAVYTVAPGSDAAQAELRLQIDTLVQANDGIEFSIYPLPEPLDLFGDEDVLIGVVNRYYETGSMPEQTRPAAVDTTAPGASSFFALWSGDAADPPELSEAVEITLFDGLLAANLMIRGGGRLAPVVDVPALDPLAALLMLTLLLAAGLRRLPG